MSDVYTDQMNQMAQTSLPDKIKMLVQWAPAIALLTAITAAKPGRDRVAAVMALLQYAAIQTPVKMDDQVVAMLTKTLLTAEGGALVDYLHSLFLGLAEQQQYAERHRPSCS
jgi:hypothetical protein